MKYKRKGVELIKKINLIKNQNPLREKQKKIVQQLQ